MELQPNLPPISRIKGFCIAHDFQQKTCPFFVGELVNGKHMTQQILPKCSWGPFSKKDPACEQNWNGKQNRL